MLKLLINSLTKKYFQFSGRASRKEYIIFLLFFYLIGTLLKLLISKYDLLNSNKLGYFPYIMMFYVTFLAIPYFSLTTRRLHDLNFNGWWNLLIFILGIFICIFFSESNTISIITYILISPLFIFKGTNGTNRYGEPSI